MSKSKRGAVVGRLLVVGVALSVITACSGSGSGDEQAVNEGTKLVNTAPAAVGDVDSIVWNLTSGEPDTLAPSEAATLGGGQVVQNVCDALVQRDPAFNLKPRLADFEQKSPTELVYTIRGDAKFWDGKPVTTDDVVFSMTRAQKSPITGIFFVNVSSIEATGDRAVTVKFSKPDARFNAEMASLPGFVYEKAFAEAAGKKFGTASGGLMCSGPFKLDKWTSGDNITISRNDDYWDKDRIPKVGKVKFTFVTDASALTQALKTGEIDGAYEISPAAISTLRKSSAGHLYFGSSTQGTGIAIANPGGPTADPKFRQALQLLVDREGIAKSVYKGAATPDYTVVTPRTWPNDQQAKYQAAYDTFASERKLNVKKATELVKQSSYKGEELKLAIAAGDPTGSQLAQLFQQQVKAAGVKIKIDQLGPLEFSQVGYDAAKRKDYDLTLGSSFNAITDPLEPALFDFLPGPYNYTGIDDPKLTDLLGKALAEIDPAKRADLTIEAQTLWEGYNAIIPIVQTNTVTFLNKRLGGATTSFAYWSGPNMVDVGAAK